MFPTMCNPMWSVWYTNQHWTSFPWTIGAIPLFVAAIHTDSLYHSINVATYSWTYFNYIHPECLVRSSPPRLKPNPKPIVFRAKSLPCGKRHSMSIMWEGFAWAYIRKPAAFGCLVSPEAGVTFAWTSAMQHGGEEWPQKDHRIFSTVTHSCPWITATFLGIQYWTP